MELDNLVAETAATMSIKHPDYASLAARVAVSNLHKETKKNFSGIYKILNRIICNYYFNNFIICKSLILQR